MPAQTPADPAAAAPGPSHTPAPGDPAAPPADTVTLQTHDLAPLAALLTVSNPPLALWRGTAHADDLQRLSRHLAKHRSLRLPGSARLYALTSPSALLPPWLSLLHSRAAALPIPLTLALFSTAAQQLGGTMAGPEADAARNERGVRAAVLLSAMHDWFLDATLASNREQGAAVMPDAAVLEAAAVARVLDGHVRDSGSVSSVAAGVLMTMMLAQLRLGVRHPRPPSKALTLHRLGQRTLTAALARLHNNCDRLQQLASKARLRFRDLVVAAEAEDAPALLCMSGMHGGDAHAARHGRAAALQWLAGHYLERWSRVARLSVHALPSGGLETAMDLFLEAVALHKVTGGGPLNETAKLVEEVRIHLALLRSVFLPPHPCPVVLRRCAVL